MFPMTMTIHNEAQLRAVFKVLGVAAEIEYAAEEPKAKPAVKETKPVKPVEQPKAEEQPPVEEPNGKAYTLDDAKRLTTEVVKAGKRDAMVALLAEFKVQQASKLTAEQLPAFCSKAEALLS